MLRRSMLSLLLSGASVTALAACGGGSDEADTTEEQTAGSEQESKAQPKADPTAAPAQAQPTAAPEKQADAAPELDLPMLGKAPEIDLTSWFNSEPIKLSSLEGKAAAMVVFWTYT